MQKNIDLRPICTGYKSSTPDAVIFLVWKFGNLLDECKYEVKGLKGFKNKMNIKNLAKDPRKHSHFI